MVRGISVEREVRNLVPRAPRNSHVPLLQADHGRRPSELPRRPGNTVPGHSVERHSVNRLEQLPVKKARCATGTERGYLVKAALTSAVPQPGVTGEPSHAP